MGIFSHFIKQQLNSNIIEKIKMDNSAPEIAVDAVLKASEKMPEDSKIVKGYDFNNGLDYAALLATYKFSGFQATNFGKAVDEINNMVGKCSNYFKCE